MRMLCLSISGTPVAESGYLRPLPDREKSIEDRYFLTPGLINGLNRVKKSGTLYNTFSFLKNLLSAR
jgi:hypothetical protein